MVTNRRGRLCLCVLSSSIFPPFLCSGAGLANYGPQPKSSPVPVFVDELCWGAAMSSVLGLPKNTVVEENACKGGQRAREAQIFTICPLQKKFAGPCLARLESSCFSTSFTVLKVLNSTCIL